eukprot:671568-Amphidinium_carterae.1
MACGRKSPSRQSNPPAPPANVQPANRPARGRSPVQAAKYHVEEEKRQEEKLSIEDLLFKQMEQSAKKLLFVGECTHLFSVAAAQIVKQKLPSLTSLPWSSTELQWPRDNGREAELGSSRARLREFGVIAREGVDATRLHLANLQGFCQ